MLLLEPHLQTLTSQPLALPPHSSLARLSWFFLLGTGSQLLAVAVVVYQLVSDPDPDAVTEYYRPLTAATLPSQVVALMNIIFAFGGQFAFVEIMTCMKKPAAFPRAVTLCTVIMGSMYAGLGAVGYWSRGNKVSIGSRALKLQLVWATSNLDSGSLYFDLTVYRHNFNSVETNRWKPKTATGSTRHNYIKLAEFTV